MEKQNLLQRIQQKVVSKQEPSRLKKGNQAEQFALKYLQQQGLYRLAQNYHCRHGEIDIIMKDKETIVFVEVRYRKSSKYGSAAETVNATKQRKIRMSAQYYLIQERLGDLYPLRFDVIGIDVDEIHWIKNAF